MSTNRYRRRPKIRYDRIIGVFAILIVFIIILVSCCKSCGKDNDKKGDPGSSVIPTEVKNSSQDDNPNGEENSNGSDSENAQTDMNYKSISAMPNDVSKGDLILVNSDYQYEFPSGEETGENEIVPIYENMSDSYQAKDYEISLNKKTILAVNDLMDAFYNETGHTDLMIVSGYRTKEEQDADYESGDSEIQGGCSEYHTGMSFSLTIWGDNPYYFENSGDYSWISENCANYGFITRYPKGKEGKTGIEGKDYQFRYVGIPHSTYMYENNLCLEEYLSLIKDHPFDGEHLSISVGEKKYEVYFVTQNPAGNTDISVPSDKTYTVSGNNSDGFIVTVEL